MTQTTPATTVAPASVRPSTDRYAIANGLRWEARFVHPTIGGIVLPYATEAEARAEIARRQN